MPRKISCALRLALVSAAAVLFVSAPFAFAQGATVQTDKPDYAPEEIAVITGAGFEPGETVTLEVDHADGTPPGGAGHEPWDVTADPAGGFTTTWHVDADDSAWSTFLLTAVGGTSGLTAETTFTDSAIGTYDQCSNDDGDGYTSGDTGCRWINGNLQSNNSTYFEGDATVQRVWLTEFPPGSTHTLRLKYGTTKGGKHAYDFLTTWNWSEDWITVADRCQDVTGCTTAGETTIDIPQDPNAPDSFEPSAPGDRQFTMRGGTLNSASTPTITSGSYAGDSETVITINFTVASSGSMCTSRGCSIALWFGAHVSAQANWGLGNGAGSINGSPYHVSLDAVDNSSIGQRDNQMQATVVTAVPNGTIVIVKNAVPNDAQDFSFNLNNNSTISQDFSLDDDDDATLPSSQTFSVPPGSWSASELNIPAPWSLTSLVCDDPTDDSVVNEATATINLASNETVTCTYTDTKDLCAGVTCNDTICADFACDPADGVCKVAAFSQPGTVCGGSGEDCDALDTCDGAGNCVDNVDPADTLCRGAAGVCDVAELCTGSSKECPSDGFQSGSFECRGSAGVCDVAELCTGSAAECPSDGFQPSSFECRGSAGVCDVAESCTGSAADCPSDGFQPSSFECRGSAGVCDVAESCTGSAAECPADGFQPSSFECRASAGVCDVSESCTGSATDCPADGFQPSTVVCNAGSGDLCDPDELCTGSGADCPSDIVASGGTVCNPGSGDLCDPDEVCSGTADEACPSDIVASTTTLCNAGSGDLCDPDEFCTGVADATCPADVVASTTTLCNAGSGDLCDPDEFCTGVAEAACPADVITPATTVCNPGSGDLCDPDELCTGVANQACPADVIAPTTTVCNPGSGDVCDPDELCTGVADQGCPADVFKAADFVCNPGSGDPNDSGFVCDPDELCTGTPDAACPTDTYASADTVCNAGSGDVCDPDEVCTGVADGPCPADTVEPAGTQCRADSGLCDVKEECTGTAGETCPADAREECAVVTSSSICTFNVTDACSGAGNEFKLIYTPDAKNWVAYKLNGSNPGQYYYNLFVEGQTSVTVQIPWPFVTQGANPVHVFDADDVTSTNTCITYPPNGVAHGLTITIADRLNGKSAAGAAGGFVSCPGPLSGLPGPPPSPDDICTIQVPLPSTAGYFVAIHLDYGFKGIQLDANPVDTFADRYDRALNLSALVNTADNTGPLAIPQCHAHNFCHAAGNGSETGCDLTDVVRNSNEFKKIAGVFGRLTNPSGDAVSGHVNLYRPGTGQIVAQGDTDPDGFYLITYKHLGSPETYQVQMTSTNPSYPGGLNFNVQLKANGWAEANFKWNGSAWTVVQ